MSRRHAAVLKHIRDNPGLTGAKIAEAFRVPLRPPARSGAVGAEYMAEVLAELAEAGLIVKQAQPRSGYKVADWWGGVQRALDISLSDLALRQEGRALTVRPLFGAPVAQRAGERTAFVVMPFSEEMSPVYRAIHAALDQCGLATVRGDDLYAVSDRNSHGGRIIDEVWSAICAAQLVVADCTGRNPNVMYELGIAHTLGRPVMLVSRTKDDIPFDVGHLRFILYAAGESGLVQLQREIVKQLQGPAVTGTSRSTVL